MTRQNDDETARGMGQGYALLTIGITFALTLTGAVLAGLWADRRLGTTPLFLVLGTVFGMAMGGFWMAQKLRVQRGSRDAPK